MCLYQIPNKIFGFPPHYVVTCLKERTETLPDGVGGMRSMVNLDTQHLGIRGLGFRVRGMRFSIEGSGFRVYYSGLEGFEI